MNTHTDNTHKTPSKDGSRTTQAIFKIIGSGLPIFFFLSIISHC